MEMYFTQSKMQLEFENSFHTHQKHLQHTLINGVGDRE